MRSKNLRICTCFALWCPASAITGSCVNETSWIPGCEGFSQNFGTGPSCYGVWTKKWQEHHGGIPEGLMSRLQNHDFRHLLLDGVCPYGVAMPGSVTWPDSRRYGDTVAGMNSVKFVAVIYSYIPYFVACIVAICWLYHMKVVLLFSYRNHIARRSQEGRASSQKPFAAEAGEELKAQQDFEKLTMLLFFAGLVVFVCEVCLKPLCGIPRPGAMLQQRDAEGRYAGSCVESCGFPSSHSALAMGWFAMIIKDLVKNGLEVLPEDKLEDRTCGCWHAVSNNWKLFIRPCLLSHDVQKLDTLSFYILRTWWFFGLAPVPFMRVVLYDHSIHQVFWGSGVGLVLAAFWWNFTRCWNITKCCQSRCLQQGLVASSSDEQSRGRDERHSTV